MQRLQDLTSHISCLIQAALSLGCRSLSCISFSTQPFFQCLHHRAVNPETPLPPIEPWLKAALERPDVISEHCEAPLKEVKRIFPLTEVEKKKNLKTSAQIFGKGYV